MGHCIRAVCRLLEINELQRTMPPVRLDGQVVSPRGFNENWENYDGAGDEAGDEADNEADDEAVR